eukprot:TRINITY_DN8540_c0_g1_i2.p1 TRINITY_DN8540_c0_g1~~TRINITY_DN8540_c0_g1_i2.p1  ORF type:complete len:221 (-),score=86.70 TRINITY_DN8540_c0_g1_i2:21-683(-)
MAQDHDEDYSMLLKVMVVGDQAVGKTSLISRFVAGTFAGDSVVGDIGVKMQMRSLRLELPNATKVVRFQFWDTEGQKDFRHVTPDYYRHAHAVVLMYDVTRRSTFESVREWLAAVQRHNPSALCVVVGGKCDRGEVRAVTFEEAKEWAHNIGLEAMETSAKEEVRVEEVFELIARRAHHRQLQLLGKAPPHALSAPALLSSSSSSSSPSDRRGRLRCLLC